LITMGDRVTVAGPVSQLGANGAAWHGVKQALVASVKAPERPTTTLRLSGRVVVGSHSAGAGRWRWWCPGL